MYIIDLHCDTLDKLYCNNRYSFFKSNGFITDLALYLGGYAAQCFAIYQPAYVKGNNGYMFFRQQYNRFKKITSASRYVTRAKSLNVLNKCTKNRNVLAVLTVENADFLQNDLTKLKIIEHSGVKILGLIHNSENCLGFPNSNVKEIDRMPLKPFGKKVVEAVNFCNMLIDVSHLNTGGFYDVAAISEKPFIASHSACRTICDNPRNLYDEQIRIIAESGGVVGLCFYSRFLNGTNKTDITDILRHYKHLINIGGSDVAAIGSDFDGMDCNLFIKSASEMPIFADALIKEFGFYTAEKICFKNALRILK